VTALSLIAVVLFCVLLLLVVVFVSVRMMGSLFKRRSGYARLAANYPAPGPPQGHVLRGQTVQFGAVRYTRCVTVGVDDEGLFLAIVSRSLGPHRPVVVPWSDVRASYASRIRLHEAVELVVGAPPVAALRLMPGVYAEFRSRLAQAAPRV
jgi:hypothetical protein